ncbi:MAG: hypothetical protein AAGB32_03825 [Pseudomonadota bacterium]
MPQKAHAGLFCICPPFGPSCVPYVADCSRNACECQSNLETGPDTQDVNTIDHITDEFIRHREWLVNVVFEAHVLPAMMLMTEQLTTAAMDQMLILGGFLDAKHQLETQRLVQTMEARAHAQYHPSEGMCQFGTMTRSLAATQRDKEITAFAMASRFIQRQNMNGDGISAGGASDDFRSRFEQMTNVFCNPEDLSGGLDDICNSTDAARMNNDVNFTNIALKNNLALNLATSPAPSEDEEDVMAMQANLYGHRIMPRIPEDRMSNNDGTIIKSAAETYLKMRALTAKRSVAQASFANFIADRTHGGDLVQPYMIAALEQMGIGEEQAIDLFGERPSYHTQMMFLTNTMLQDPTFYSDLYDKPENVDRKKVSIQAINLKLRHDMYDSVLRSNANQAVLLEALLQEPADRVSNEILFGERNSEIMNLPGLN